MFCETIRGLTTVFYKFTFHFTFHSLSALHKWLRNFKFQLKKGHDYQPWMMSNVMSIIIISQEDFTCQN